MGKVWKKLCKIKECEKQVLAAKSNHNNLLYNQIIFLTVTLTASYQSIKFQFLNNVTVCNNTNLSHFSTTGFVLLPSTLSPPNSRSAWSYVVKFNFLLLSNNLNICSTLVNSTEKHPASLPPTRSTTHPAVALGIAAQSEPVKHCTF